jgi:uncharacterized protein (TIGR00645 family)
MFGPLLPQRAPGRRFWGGAGTGVAGCPAGSLIVAVVGSVAVFLVMGLIMQESGVLAMERFVEALIYRSRWALAPIYLGLSIAVMALGVIFFRELFHLVTDSTSLKEADAILIVLTLIDISMVGGLLVMVMMSGYENFVSTLNVKDGEEKLRWLGTMDSASLKVKVAASIVAISSIHLLKIFMDAGNVPNDKIMWNVLMHLTFVLSAFMMGFLDKLTKKDGPPDHSVG